MSGVLSVLRKRFKIVCRRRALCRLSISINFKTLLVHDCRALTQSKLLSVLPAAVIYTQAYNQVLANQQQQQAAQLIASANPTVAATSGIAGLGLLGLTAQKEGKYLMHLLLHLSHLDLSASL